MAKGQEESSEGDNHVYLICDADYTNVFYVILFQSLVVSDSLVTP